MLMTRKMAYAFTVITLCSFCLLGCSEEQEKSQVNKTETMQEQMGKEAAQHIQQPLEKAHQAAEAVNAAAQDTKQHAQEIDAEKTQASGKVKKQLEGC
jgi:ABC-type uncharacterized transport system auxiliary subunit